MMADASQGQQLKKVVVRPEASLEPGPDDRILTSKELEQFALFGSLQRKISIERFPGSLVLRRFRRGEVICRQGERGYSAFYIASREDLAALKRFCGQAEAPDWSERQSADPQQEATTRQHVVTAYILGPAAPTAKRPGLIGGMLSQFRGVAQSSIAAPEFIPNDGSHDIDYETRKAPMFEGDVFGEMSCMTYGPRSATVTAEQDCFLVEFLRNIFDQMQRDAGYRRRVDQDYSDRVLSTHLRRLDFFRELTDAQLDELRQAAHLEVVDPGTVLCDEGDVATDVYIIRRGLVQVMRGVDVVLNGDDVADWPALCRDLLGCEKGETPAVGQPRQSAKGQPKPGKPANVQEILAAARATKKSGRPIDHSPATSKQPTPAQDKQRTRDTQNTGGSPGETAGSPERARAELSEPQRAQTPAELEAEQHPARTIKASAPLPSGSPRLSLWQWLEPAVQEAVRTLAASDNADEPQHRRIVIGAINGLIRNRQFLSSKDLTSVLESDEVYAKVSGFPKGLHGVKKDWSELQVRVGGRLAMQAMLPTLPKRVGNGKPPEIVNYLGRGDCFGEMAVVLKSPRRATCLAYDHPSDDPGRKPGRAELVRIEGAAFDRLLECNPELNTRIRKLVQQRLENDQEVSERQPWEMRKWITTSPEFRNEGLIQGQDLLLIDLDSCTRCGDCVRACVKTHDDGYSRLFLDGPRFDRFLIPSACRQCLNPSCMIGCPVGSIQRGDNGQILIRDWCIGCGLCARQCPYDSIQMHDVGIVPADSLGWQYLPLSAVSQKSWQTSRWGVGKWEFGAAPFEWTLDLRQSLAQTAADGKWPPESVQLAEPVCFRYVFQMSWEERASATRYRLLLISERLAPQVWINGNQVPLTQDARQQRRGEFEARLPVSALRWGKNVIAAMVSPIPGEQEASRVLGEGQTIFSARLDPIPEAGELSLAVAGTGMLPEVELVTEKAIVCDLCSNLLTQRPACVDQCPHGAAIRVNASLDFTIS